MEGKQKYKYVSYHEKISEANKALREYLVNPYDLNHKNMTMYDIYLEWEKTSKLSDITIRGYRSAFNQSLRLHKKKIRDVRIGDLEDAMYELKPSMQSGYKNVIQHIYKYAIKFDMIDKNLGDFLTPEKKQAKKRVPFTRQQIEQIKAFNHKYTDIVVILLYTGMRINELLSIEKENVHLQDRYMMGGLKTKAGKDRVIPIHRDIAQIVKRYYESSDKYLIEHKGKPVHYRTFMTIFWKRLQDYLGTDQTPHCTRHTFISQADNCNLNKTVVKKIVGHTTGDVTNDIYTHKGMQQLVYEIDKFEY